MHVYYLLVVITFVIKPRNALEAVFITGPNRRLTQPATPIPEVFFGHMADARRAIDAVNATTNALLSINPLKRRLGTQCLAAPSNAS